MFGGKKNDSKLDPVLVSKDKNTRHENTISDVKRYVGDANAAQSIATSDINGFIYFWDVSKA